METTTENTVVPLNVEAMVLDELNKMLGRLAALDRWRQQERCRRNKRRAKLAQQVQDAVSRKTYWQWTRPAGKFPRKQKKRLGYLARLLNHFVSYDALTLRDVQERIALHRWRQALTLLGYERELRYLHRWNLDGGITFSRELRLQWCGEYDNGLYTETFESDFTYPEDAFLDELVQELEPSEYPTFTNDLSLLRWLRRQALPSQQ